LHDLIAALATEHGPAPTHVKRVAALHRVVDYYLRAAHLADHFVTPERFRVPLQLMDRATALPALTGYDAAFTWLQTEEDNLAAACLAAERAGLDVACWQLAFTLRCYYFLAKLWRP
jgi:hypothetical protein